MKKNFLFAEFNQRVDYPPVEVGNTYGTYRTKLSS